MPNPCGDTTTQSATSYILASRCVGQYSQHDLLAAILMATLNTPITIENATLNVNLDAANNEVAIYGSPDSGTTRVILNTRTDGVLRVSSTIDEYQSSDIDESADPKYYGFLRADGHWYIIQNNSAAGTFRYVSGATDYIISWTGRAGLTYGYFDSITL
jgi:hypothetical protein